MVAATKEDENRNEGNMNTIKQKKRSLKGHKLQLGNHTKDCRSKIGHYKAVKSTEAREMVDRAFQKVLDQQVKCGEIFGELIALDKTEED